MKVLLCLVVMLRLAIFSKALTCWVCENARSNFECLRKGQAKTCLPHQDSCQNELRRRDYRILITKRCKQSLACGNNYVQNPRPAWFPSQCNSRAPSSVCRCCCGSELCNRDSIDCGRVPTTAVTTAAHPPNPVCSLIKSPENGNIMDCKLKNKTILETNQVEIGTECQFNCSSGFHLEGFNQSTCVIDRETLQPRFNRPAPKCVPICQELEAPANGNISCSNNNQYNSTCTFACDETKGFILFPETNQTVCTIDGKWDKSAPCCARTCPPYAIMDLVVVLDSSSSIGRSNWNVMKAIVKNFTFKFNFSSEFSRLSAIRYNSEVDTNSQILFNSYLDDEIGLMAAFDVIPYDGSGTRTGKALEYVNTTLLTEKNGDRPKVQDVIIVITDGTSGDAELLRNASDDLRTHHKAKTYAIGIRNDKGNLNSTQLEQIGGGPNNVFEAESGFEGLGKILESRVSKQVCRNRRCSKEV